MGSDGACETTGHTVSSGVNNMGDAAWTVTRKEGTRLDLHTLDLHCGNATKEGGNSLASSILAIPHLGRRAMDKGAEFSPCRTYRYDLWRSWNEGYGEVAFIGLNPSTADETLDDPTIRRCMAYAKGWGFAGVHMLNLFAFRATDPAIMKKADEPIGPDNDEIISTVAKKCTVVVAAWGVHGTHRGRDREVRKLVPDLHTLKLTKAGHPNHPLYLPKTLKFFRWNP